MCVCVCVCVCVCDKDAKRGRKNDTNNFQPPLRTISTKFWVCKHCQFVFPSSVLSVMSVSGFPLIIMSAHAQCSMCTCSVEGIPSLVCPHMLSVGASLISMQCKHWRRRRKIKKILRLRQKSIVFARKKVVFTTKSVVLTDWTQTQTDSGDLLQNFAWQQSVK